MGFLCIVYSTRYTFNFGHSHLRSVQLSSIVNNKHCTAMAMCRCRSGGWRCTSKVHLPVNRTRTGITVYMGATIPLLTGSTNWCDFIWGDWKKTASIGDSFNVVASRIKSCGRLFEFKKNSTAIRYQSSIPNIVPQYYCCGMQLF